MIYCNECKHEFEIKIRTRYIKDSIEEVFFNCPNCHERYTAYYTNDKIKLKQKQLQHLTRKNGRSKAINKLSKEIEIEMNKLEELIGTQ